MMVNFPTIHQRFLVTTSTLLIIQSCRVACQQQQANPHSNSPIRAAERVRNEPESVWQEFVQLASDYKPLNLGQGFPDFAAPEYLIDSLRLSTNQTNPETVLHHQYTRSFGNPKLVGALRTYYSEFRGFRQLTNANEQILITVGAYEALFCSIMAFVGPGDQVLLIDPAFDAYAPMVQMAGGTSVFIPLRRGNQTITGGGSGEAANQISSSADYRLDMAEFEAKITNKTRALVLNTPNNPLGKVFSELELRQIADLCAKYNLLVVADEVYEQFYYSTKQSTDLDGPTAAAAAAVGTHVSIASLPGMWNRTITIGSAGKTFSVTGWKIGWAFGPQELIKYLQLIHQTAVYTVATPLQLAVARTFEHEMELIRESANNSSNKSSLYWSQLRKDLLAKRNRMAKILQKSGKFKPILPEGGYFMFVDFSQFARENPEYFELGKYNNTSVAATQEKSNSIDFRFARWLAKVKRLQAIPGSAFYSLENKKMAENQLRFCFIKKDETLDDFEKLIKSF